MRTIRTSRVLGGVLASVLLIAACGDDSDDSDTASDEEGAAPSGEAGAFCEEAASLQSAMVGAMTPSEDGAEAAEGDTDHAATLRAIDPPDEIAEDWEQSIPVLADFMEAGVAASPYLEDVENFDPTGGRDALAEAGVTDPEAVEALGALTEAQQAFTDEDVQAAGGRVGAYIQEHCGQGES